MPRKPIPIIAYMPDGSVLRFGRVSEARAFLHISHEKLTELIDTGAPYTHPQTKDHNLNGATFDYANDEPPPQA